MSRSPEKSKLPVVALLGPMNPRSCVPDHLCARPSVRSLTQHAMGMPVEGHGPTQPQLGGNLPSCPLPSINLGYSCQSSWPRACAVLLSSPVPSGQECGRCMRYGLRPHHGTCCLDKNSKSACGPLLLIITQYFYEFAVGSSKLIEILVHTGTLPPAL
ncbi:hypothetical protein AAY473_026684 [Plecturocebus cupreus]